MEGPLSGVKCLKSRASGQLMAQVHSLRVLLKVSGLSLSHRAHNVFTRTATALNSSTQMQGGLISLQWTHVLHLLCAADGAEKIPRLPQFIMMALKEHTAGFYMF